MNDRDHLTCVPLAASVCVVLSCVWDVRDTAAAVGHKWSFDICKHSYGGVHTAPSHSPLYFCFSPPKSLRPSATKWPQKERPSWCLWDTSWKTQKEWSGRAVLKSSWIENPRLTEQWRKGTGLWKGAKRIFLQMDPWSWGLWQKPTHTSLRFTRAPECQYKI